MKKIVIAEKPHLERLVVSLISETFNPVKVKGSNMVNYYESPNYIVTHSYGHIFDAYDIEDYTKEPVEWKMDNLPFFPPDNHFLFRLKRKRDEKTHQMVPDDNIRLQFQVIKTLLNDPNISAIIHCGDADREGEIIVRQIIKNSGVNKPVYRLWFNEETQEAFNESFHNMKPDSEYDNIASEGFTRLKNDWLYGINLTRYISLKVNSPKGKPFRNGRVIDAMTQAIYDRDMEIANFVPEMYFALVSDMETKGEQIHLRSKNTFPIFQKKLADDKCTVLNSAGASVTDVIKETKVIGPGKLFSLTKLQSIISNKYGISIDETLKICQKLYESGYITYPRTNTEYLGTTETDKVQMRIDEFNKLGYNLELKTSKMIFDNSKIDGHSALCPTHKHPTDLTGNDLIVYDTIKNRFCAVFCAEKCTVDRTAVKITCADESFSITGNTLLTKGFLAYEDRELAEKELPDFNIGDIIKVSFQPIEEETKPKSHFTESTFLEFLESPFADEKTTEEERYNSMLKGLEIGTVASRTSIIENMINNGYIDKKNKTYNIAPAGIFLIETLKRLDIDLSKEKTVEMSEILKKVNKGELTETEAIKIAAEDIKKMFTKRNEEIPGCQESGIVNPLGGMNNKIVGECPLCDGNVYELPYGFQCEHNTKENKECNFIIFQNDKYIQKVTGKSITSSNVTSVLSKGFYIGKTKTSKGQEYEVMLTLKMNEDESVGWTINNNIGKCPVCGSPVKATPFGYICTNNVSDNPNSCFFILFRNDKFINAFTKKPLSLSQVISLINKGSFKCKCEKKNGSGKYGLKFSLMIDRHMKKIEWTKSFAK